MIPQWEYPRPSLAIWDRAGMWVGAQSSILSWIAGLWMQPEQEEISISSMGWSLGSSTGHPWVPGRDIVLLLPVENVSPM